MAGASTLHVSDGKSVAMCKVRERERSGLRHVMCAHPGWRWAWSSATRAMCLGNDNDTVVLIVTGAVEFVAYPVDDRVHS
jgi:hypothetical protein